MRISLSNCDIRSWRPADAPAIVEHLNNQNVLKTLADRVPHPYTLRDAQQFIRKSLDDSEELSFAISVEDTAVGAIGIRFVQPENPHAAEIGYWLGEAYWRRGIATQALHATTEYTFKTFDIARIQAHVFDGNIASMRVLEKCGYTREGFLRKSSLKAGQLVDQYLYAIVR